jgi:hypothetical protein
MIIILVVILGYNLVQDKNVIHPARLDNFLIGEIYPTKPAGREWYVNMAYPNSDLYLRNLEFTQFSKQPDGSWRVNSTNGQIRMEAWSQLNEKWLNVEITMYAKIINSNNYLLQMYSRGGNHIYNDPCIGSAYKARLYGDGRATWVKEVTFPAYTDERGEVQTGIKSLGEGRWVGFKAVIYNFVENGKTYVRMESYVDSDVTGSRGNLMIKNNWKLASVVEDRGGWFTYNDDFDSKCGIPRDAILTGPGGTVTQNVVAWRTDNTTWDFKYLSAREIQPPR